MKQERKPCAHHKRTGMGEHFNTKWSVEFIRECRKLMQPPLRMKKKEVALKMGIPYETMLKKLEEYGV